jgi:hypothetical protein
MGARAFDTRYGTCRIYPDRIEIERRDLTGWLGTQLFRRGIHQASALYLIGGLALLLGALCMLLLGNYFLTIFLLMFSAFGFYAMRLNRGFSFAPLILREQVEGVSFHPAEEGLSRAAFSIRYRAGSRLLARRIPMPGGDRGEEITAQALRMFRDERLLDESP